MTKPDILWIMADELRADALSCYGTPHPAIRTPNIDRIAEAGVLFERAYTSSPVCVPARQAMLSGISPLVSGVLNNEGYSPDAVESSPMFPEVLAAAGWSTRSYGKEHLPGERSPWQVDDHSGSSMEELRAVAARMDVDIVRSPGIGHVISAVLPEGVEVGGEQITRNVVSELEAQKTAPLFLRASYLQPHKPMVVPEPWASRYDDVEFDVPRDPDENDNAFERAWGRLTRGADLSEQEIQLSFRRYHGSVAWLDEQVGEILDALERSGRSDSTIVVFTTDHGASLGEYGILAKHTFSPESHRVPLIVSWPTRLRAGERRGDLATSEDVAATILGLAGMPVPDSMTGRDLFASDAPTHILSAIGYGEATSRAFPNRDEGAWDDGRGWPQRVCVRTPRYRLELTTRRAGEAVRSEDADVYLADTAVDPRERRNLAARVEYGGVCAELGGLISEAARMMPRAVERPAEFAALRRRFSADEEA